MKENIGGQAVIEGVMLRGKDTYVLAVRNPDNEIIVEDGQVKKLPFSDKIKKIVILRGIYALIETLRLGLYTLTVSANIVAQEDAAELSKKELVFSIGLALIIAIGFFVILPYFLAGLVEFTHNNNILFNLIDGIIKVLFLAIYIFAISFMKDIKRVFQYHGAEHKVVNTYEHDEPLTIENSNKYTTLHLRCGTNFIFLVLSLSIIFFVMIPNNVHWYNKILLRIVLIPLIVGTAYEFIKLNGKYPKNILLKILVSPGLLLQKITTRVPDDNQIEVAISAAERLLELLNLDKGADDVRET